MFPRDSITPTFCFAQDQNECTSLVCRFRKYRNNVPCAVISISARLFTMKMSQHCGHLECTCFTIGNLNRCVYGHLKWLGCTLVNGWLNEMVLSEFQAIFVGFETEMFQKIWGIRAAAAEKKVGTIPTLVCVAEQLTSSHVTHATRYDNKKVCRFLSFSFSLKFFFPRLLSLSLVFY